MESQIVKLECKLRDYVDIYVHETDSTIRRIFYDKAQGVRRKLFWLKLLLKIKNLF